MVRGCGFLPQSLADSQCVVAICSLSTCNENLCIPERCNSNLFGATFAFPYALVSHLCLYSSPATHSYWRVMRFSCCAYRDVRLDETKLNWVKLTELLNTGTCDQDEALSVFWGLGNRMRSSAREAGCRKVFAEAGVCFKKALLKIS